MDAVEIRVAINQGLLDKELDRIEEFIRARRERLSAMKLEELRPGDLVRFVRLGMGAKYMNGHTAIVDSINWKTAWVRLTPETKEAIRTTRFGRSSRIKVYPGNLELVDNAINVTPRLKSIEDIIPVDGYVVVSDTNDEDPFDGEE